MMATKMMWNDGALKTITDELVRKKLTRSVATVENEAKRLCRVDTGRLQASITSAVGDTVLSKPSGNIKPFNKSGQPSTPISPYDGIQAPGDPLIGVVGTNVEYGIYREFEDSYLRNALHQSESKIAAICKEKE